MKLTREIWWWLAALVLAALLAGCETVPIDTGPSGGGGGGIDPTGGGIHEVDDLTDPRLSHSEQLSPIGTLTPVGPRVMLSGEAVRGPARVPNGAHLATEAGSAARIVYLTRGGRCEVVASDFRIGNMYAETRRCRHRMETTHATAIGGAGGTAFEVSVFEQATRITVFQGVVEAGPRGGNLRPVTAGNEIVISPSGVQVGPARSTADWRRKWGFVTGGGGGGGPTGNDRFCGAFSQQAVTDFEENLRRRCGFEGFLWSPDQRSHFDRCMRNADPRPFANREETLRREALARCRERPVPPPPPPIEPDREKVSFCSRYAEVAVAANRDNLQRRCGYSGAAWQSDQRGHFDWCMSGDNWRRFAPSEEQQRRDALARCRPPGPSPAEVEQQRRVKACTQYAQAAVSQNQDNIKNRCNFTGAAWTSNQRAHYDWCMAGDNLAKNAPNETKNRREALARCTAPPVIR